jgi:hypothetical protein
MDDIIMELALSMADVTGIGEGNKKVLTGMKKHCDV